MLRYINIYMFRYIDEYINISTYLYYNIYYAYILYILHLLDIIYIIYNIYYITYIIYIVYMCVDVVLAHPEQSSETNSVLLS